MECVVTEGNLDFTNIDWDCHSAKEVDGAESKYPVKLSSEISRWPNQRGTSLDISLDN